ncbi:MAG: hypothetical protein AAF443_05695 [Chlamydiota bacterium]
MIWRGYFDRLFPWVLIRQVDKNPSSFMELSFALIQKTLNFYATLKGKTYRTQEY